MPPAEVGNVLEMESTGCVCNRLVVALTTAGAAELDGWAGGGGGGGGGWVGGGGGGCGVGRRADSRGLW